MAATAAGVEPRTRDRSWGRGHRQCVPGLRQFRSRRWLPAPDFGARRCFWHQTHVEAHERIAYPARSLHVARPPSLSLSCRLLRLQLRLRLRLCMFGVSMRINFAILLLRSALVVAVDTNGYERLINQMHMHDSVLCAPESELAACGMQHAAGGKRLLSRSFMPL